MFTKTCLGDTLGPLLVFQLARAPRLQLISNLLPTMASRRNHDVAMVRAAVHCVEMPCPKLAMPGNRFFDNRTLRFIKNDRFLDHLLTAPVRQQGLWKLIAFVPLRPASFIAWQPGSVASPRYEIGERIVVHGSWKLCGRGSSGTAQAVRFRKPSGFASKSIYHRTACAVRLRCYSACALPLLVVYSSYAHNPEISRP